MIDRSELHEIRQFTAKSEADKAFNTLKGIVEGIEIDSIINDTEVQELKNWCNNHYELIDRAPFKEIIPFINNICEDNEITQDEYADLKWMLSQTIDKNKYYDVITAKVQELEGIMHGILADNQVTDEEIKNLEKWLFDNEELIGVYPFDEIEALIVGITNDGVITDKERAYLKLFISDFIERKGNSTVDFQEIETLKNDITIAGVCTINPFIEFKDHQFCFTGISKKYTRSALEGKIAKLGGVYKNSVSKKTDYLIIGESSNPCWAYSCYGRKVEEAVNLRKSGGKISIVKEIDFDDAAVE